MVDVLVGNVILTGILAVALVLFVASASGLAQLYTLHIDGTLLGREAVYVAQSVQQLYLAVNSTQTTLPQSVVLSLAMPEKIGGDAYTISVASSTPRGTDETNLTVTVKLTGSTLSESVSTIIGRCAVYSNNPMTAYPVLKINMTLSLVGSQEECVLVFT